MACQNVCCATSPLEVYLGLVVGQFTVDHACKAALRQVDQACPLRLAWIGKLLTQIGDVEFLPTLLRTTDW